MARRSGATWFQVHRHGESLPVGAPVFYLNRTGFISVDGKTGNQLVAVGF